MRASEIVIGETYTVKVPDRLDINHPLYSSSGDTFELTVTNVVGQGIVGVRVWDGVVTVLLTAEQVARFGLDPAGRYCLVGALTDATTGAYVTAPLPESEECAVPARWVYPRGRRF